MGIEEYLRMKVRQLEEDVARLKVLSSPDRGTINGLTVVDLTTSNLSLKAPFRLFSYNYGGGTTGGPEADPKFQVDGYMYLRLNYDAGGTNDVRVRIDGSWSSLATV